MARLMNNSLFGLLFMLVLVSHGFCEIFDVSVEEYVKMKEFLASVNKTPVKTITTKNGDVFDCVDIYKQPSLDHPLLRDHVVQLEPPSYPPMKKLRRPSSYITVMTDNDGEEDACPFGTVPMTRVHMEDLLKFGSVENYKSKYGRSGYNALGQTEKHQYAVKETDGGPFYGTQVTMNVWNPVIDTSHHQLFSLAQLWVSNQQGNDTDTVEVGWHVYPAFHRGSTTTRLFVFFTGNSYGPGSCYNSRCGFVQVHNKITPGMTLPKVSKYGGTQENITISAYKNDTSGDWWVGYEDSNGYAPVGYWPKKLFKNLDKEANRIVWGGETDSYVSSGTTYAPMGSGHFASEGYRKAAYMSNMKIKDSSGKFVDAPSNLDSQTPMPNCYKLGDNSADVATVGQHFYFGGPGGTCS
ncbi:hypothetical protein H6P81_017169 [Aristolochia fimbriata]|uniref:Neprosin PEP catalytic domain-containing protein n=1 Tax=Aristolochia fimbriata TaxID=158543 RepID=A0AAV7DXE4_ARIFI|nr:hypothetical protein H6P81_017169 [Aristolochia fimbriata]